MRILILGVVAVTVVFTDPLWVDWGKLCTPGGAFCLKPTKCRYVPIMNDTLCVDEKLKVPEYNWTPLDYGVSCIPVHTRCKSPNVCKWVDNENDHKCSEGSSV